VRSTKLLSSIEGLLGFDSRPVPPDVFSVDGESLTYGCFQRLGPDFELARHHAVELPPGVFQEGLLGGPLSEPEALDGAVTQLLEQVGEPVAEASLVLPDAWMRVSFTEAAELPSRKQARDEILRWKLRRLVPFRVDELRIGAVEVAPLPQQTPDSEEPRRLLLAFALESLLAGLEDAFARAGVRIGQIANASLSALGTLVPPRGEGLTALALVEEDGYTLAFARGRDPVLHRYKGSAGTLGDSARASFVQRDLRLTRNFLEEQLPAEPLRGVLVAAPPELEPSWIEWLQHGFGGVVEPLSRRHLPLRGADPRQPEPLWRRLAPMLGAASQEVA
jgi:hypothetical protein